MNILKLTDKPPELEAVKDKVLEELQYLRSLDTAGDGGPLLCFISKFKRLKLIYRVSMKAWSTYVKFLFPVL